MARYIKGLLLLTVLLLSTICQAQSSTKDELFESVREQMIGAGYSEAAVDSVINVTIIMQEYPDASQKYDQKWFMTLPSEVQQKLLDYGMEYKQPKEFAGNNKRYEGEYETYTFLTLNISSGSAKWTEMGIKDAEGNPILWTGSTIKKLDENSYGLTDEIKGRTRLSRTSTIFNVSQYGSDHQTATNEMRLPTYEEIKELLANSKISYQYEYAKFKEGDKYMGMPYWLQGQWMYNNPIMDGRGNIHNSASVFTIEGKGALITDAYDSNMVGVVYRDSKLKVGGLELNVNENNHTLTTSQGDVYVKVGNNTPLVGYRIEFKSTLNRASFKVLIPEECLFMTSTECGNNQIWAWKIGKDYSKLVKVDINTPMCVLPIQVDLKKGREWNKKLNEMAHIFAYEDIQVLERKYNTPLPLFEEEEITYDNHQSKPLYFGYGSRIDLTNSDSYTNFRDKYLSKHDIQKIYRKRKEIMDSVVNEMSKIVASRFKKTQDELSSNYAYKFMQSLIDEMNMHRSELFKYEVEYNFNVFDDNSTNDNLKSRIRIRVLTTKETNKLYSMLQKFLKKNATIVYDNAFGWQRSGHSYCKGSSSDSYTFGNENAIYIADVDFPDVPSQVSEKFTRETFRGIEEKWIRYGKECHNTRYKLNGTDDNDSYYFEYLLTEIDKAAKSIIKDYVERRYPNAKDLIFKTVLPLKYTKKYKEPVDYGFRFPTKNGEKIRSIKIPFLQTKFDKGMQIYDVTFEIPW